MTDAVVDAVVVGAGPAGSAAAIALARNGRRTVLLDRADFPRDKPCGDLIGVRALAQARRLGIEEAALDVYPSLQGACLTSGGGALDLTAGGRGGRRLLAGSDARVVPRRVFDAAIVAAARRAGAELRRGAVGRIGPWDGAGRTVEIGRGAAVQELRARVLVLAGGYGSRVLLGIPEPDRAGEPPMGVAMRGYLRGVTSPLGKIAFCLDDWLLPGYGWVFPLPDGRANVGVGTLARGDGAPEHLRSLYERFTTDPRSPAAAWLAGAEAEAAPRAWPLDLGPRRRPLALDGLLVAGEAASLVGPLTGAGIAFALESGEAAGETAARALAAGSCRLADLAPYERGIRRRFGRWLRMEATAQRWLSDPSHVRQLVRVTRPLPPTGAVGAKLLLHLG